MWIFGFPEKNNGISLVVPTENGYQVKMKKHRSSKWLSRNRKRKMEFCLYSFESKIKNRKRISKYPWKESAINFRQSSMCIITEIPVFTYAVGLEKGQKTVRLSLGKGEYTIKDMSAYNGVLNEDTGLYQSVFRVDKEQTKGNLIQGRIKSQKDGMFITSIPFDKGFEMTIDGVKVKCEKVNKAFLGFHLEAGKHKIRILYHAPGVTAGKIHDRSWRFDCESQGQ